MESGSLDLIEMWHQMGFVAKAVAWILFFMSMWSIGVAVERIYSREELLDTVRRSIQRATALTANDLKKGVSALATIGATAPFVGLLGTVVGVINAFTGIASTGSGGIGAVSAGIAEALVETALGLLVAIPAVWFYNYLTGRIEYFNVEMDNSSSELVDYFIKKTA
jgi:biopolymer transport protein ExbB/biopolymer transport protein TolQ